MALRQFSHPNFSTIIIWIVFVISGNFPKCSFSLALEFQSQSQFQSQDMEKLRTDLSTPSLQCGGSATVGHSEAVFIESPNFSKKKKYPNSINCKWTFHLQQGCNLAISCPTFSLNQFLCFDYLDVSDGMGRTKRFCGNEGPDSLYMEKEVTVLFHSSPSFNGVGFRCYAVCMEQGPVTHAELTAPSIPDSYTSLGQCVCGRAVASSSFSLSSSWSSSGAKNAVNDKFPWVAQLFRKNDHQLFCSATLISDQYLISASHCFSSSDTNDPSQMYVMFDESFKQLGKKNKLKKKEDRLAISISKGAESEPERAQQKEEGKRRRNVTLINRYHNHGSTFEMDPDVALLKLEKPLNFEMDDWDLTPVCLPREDDFRRFTGMRTISSQWQYDSNSENQRLWKMEATVLSNENCSAIYKNSQRISPWFDLTLSTPSTLCAQPMVKNFCQPISGASLMTVENKARQRKFTLIGVGAMSNDCATGNLRRRRQNKPKPQIYTRVTEMVTWIRENTKDSRFCKD